MTVITRQGLLREQSFLPEEPQRLPEGIHPLLPQRNDTICIVFLFDIDHFHVIVLAKTLR